MMIIFFWQRGLSVSAHCTSKLHRKTMYYQVVLQKIIRHFENKNALAKRLKKFFCITTMLGPTLHTLSPNFWRNEASEQFHILHISQISPHMTSGYFQKLKKPCMLVMSIFNRFFDDRLNRVSKNQFFTIF